MLTTSHLRTVACAARPSTDFVHVDGPCQCFFGGPAPILSTSRDRMSSLTGPAGRSRTAASRPLEAAHAVGAG
ncbi:hypothetical protein [Cellulomonas aerilata]|uniref:Uncharacterized protein n=1 Tax=Cellulomonas aerilata TaxID=515326 RepID=A0A512D9U0_9CELL|nr:hypothetical protein [Cellulomonas aerilata]GEO33147.1 hypothetical protein CAE01nite_08720 [Cellulomonas aerilata]